MQTSQNHTSSTHLFWFAKGILTWEYDTEQMLINANKQRHCNIHTWCPTHNCSEDVHPPYLLIGDLLSECSSAHVPVALGCVSWLTLHQAPHHSQQCHSAVLEPIVRSRLTTPRALPLGLCVLILCLVFLPFPSQPCNKVTTSDPVRICDWVALITAPFL